MNAEIYGVCNIVLFVGRVILASTSQDHPYAIVLIDIRIGFSYRKRLF